jgi:hypothetical protein
MGLTADDLRQQAMSREEEEANISSNSINIDSSPNSTEGTEDSNNTECRSKDSPDCRSPSDKREKWSREEILQHQEKQNQLLQMFRRRGLLDISLRTASLMRRNKELQYRLVALQAETRAFVRLVHCFS